MLAGVNRILIIRGGAIGDFVLTLPAIRLLRERYPDSRIEILGNPSIAALADGRYYADAIRSIEERGLVSFFVCDTDLPREWVEYFGSFDLIVSYLSDPEKIFERNLKRCQIKLLIAGPAQLTGSDHGALQLGRPLEKLGLHLDSAAAQLFPSDEDREFARRFLSNATRLIAIHPASGSESKNWPIEKWKALGDYFLQRNFELVVVSGEADVARTNFLKSVWSERAIRWADNLPLPHLAAVLESKMFIGHDSGISHIAAAVGGRCYLMFGPTDSGVWAPVNENVRVIQGSEGKLGPIRVEDLIGAIGESEQMVCNPFGTDSCHRR